MNEPYLEEIESFFEDHYDDESLERQYVECLIGFIRGMEAIR